MSDQAPLLKLLDAGINLGGLQTDDVLAIVLPLLREVSALHEHGRVAELDGPFAYQSSDDGGLRLLLPEGVEPTHNSAEIDRLQVPASSALRVVGESRLTIEAENSTEVQDLKVAADRQPVEIKRPCYLPGYVAWERAVGHHDAPADILCLGQVLASLSCGLDFTSSEDLALFAANRENLFQLQSRLHPVIAGVINEMTELNRHQRARDLPSLIRRLETYRDQPMDLAINRVVSAQDGAQAQRRAVQVHLRDRLFDLSRRNRLLHFRPTQSTVNLTVASVPLVVDLKSIRLDQLCVWDGRFPEEVLGGERIALSRWLRFEDQPYLSGSLDRIIQEARRDRAEYGFSQLSLVLAFLRWHNLKEAPSERIASPLLLLPVDLTRKKGVRDQYVLQAETTEAEVNAVLRQHLRQLYGIVLPDRVDLKTVAIAQFHQDLQKQIASTEPGVQVRLMVQPEIELIHQRAKQRLEQFRRRQRVRAPVAKPVTSLDYSYRADDFRPLGLKLFHERVKPTPLPLREAIGGRPEARHPQMAANEVESTTYALREASGNPYQWDLDLTAVTLGNFNYRKMSLVRDYSAMIEGDMSNPAFDRVFSLQPRALDTDPPGLLPLADQWAVVQADATQTAAVALARKGTSYIIQGPPGTGKSQTITNLIADYIGRGKRVLFVCEKRAAIDVVFHRLHQQGLDELCCMIHDSQADKKDFVLNLKQTYESWLASEDNFDATERERKTLVGSIEQDVQALLRFDAAMRAAPEHVGHAVRELIHRLVMLREHEVSLTQKQLEALPSYATWLQHGDLAHRLHRGLIEAAGVDSLAQHVFAHLGARVIGHDRPVAHLSDLCDHVETLLDRCMEVFAESMPAEAEPIAIREFLALVAHAGRLRGMAERGQLPLLDASSNLSRELETVIAETAVLARTMHRAEEQTTHWVEKLTAADAEIALEQATGQEKSLTRWLQPSWWRLSKELHRRYDFSRHAVRPQPSKVLSELLAEHKARSAYDEACAMIVTRFGGTDPERLMRELQALREEAAGQSALSQFVKSLLESTSARDQVARFAALDQDSKALVKLLEELLPNAFSLPLDKLGELVRDLREHADVLPELLPLLLELAEAAPVFGETLRSLPLKPESLEYVIARENLESVYRQERWLERFDGKTLARHVERLAMAERSLLSQNARTIRAAVRRRFRNNVQRSSLAASQLDADGKLFKKTYSAGRRELEHEFGKSMRYKAIREIASADSGRVVRDMKPIWLMSPLSVSDTLPLAPDLFDVVIFDEASQIPMEEAVPALYRAPQVIIVGDEMQLPPTSFFSAARDEDNDTLDVEEEGERLAVVLDADSLLNQGARNLPATLLAWHYRSRHEALIGFSNAAFYAGNLYTIPDRNLPDAALGDITIRTAKENAETNEGEVRGHVDALLARAISFHFVTDSVYAERRNEGEAKHIALMVRELLARESKQSLGIVAFSEAQQSEIESALDALANEDPAFAARLEAEYVREEDEQFCGLIVKNLENVQGDERDIIILSICYGRNAEGRMLMNFGPINQRGGEKRLNVIFSRARHHMAVVSSIRHDAITNDYNEGASALKQFLRYAECNSRGDRETAQRVLENLNPLARKALVNDGAQDHVALQLAGALRERGYVVDGRIGQSRFRCDLGIRDVAGSHYVLGIMIDTAAHYANRDVYERCVSRPRILNAFGWRVIQVVAIEWFHDRDAVLERIERALQASPEPEPESDTLVSEEANPHIDTPAVENMAREEAPPVPLTPDSSKLETGSSQTRRFEFVEGTSRKFWQITLKGTDVTVSFGRIGTNGQSQLKQFGTVSRAQQEVDKLVVEKLKKGYTEAA